MKLNLLETRDLTVGFQKKKQKNYLLQDLNLSIPSSSMIALVGKNGCGKSSLIRTLCGFQKSLAGEVFLDGKPFESMSFLERSKLIAVVLTEPIESTGISVYDLVALGRYPHSNWSGELNANDHEIILDSITKLGLAGFENRKYFELSDGEAQRALIAKALCQKTKLIILDEPTSFLDIQNRYHIIQLLREIAHQEEISILYSTHEMEMAMQTADLFWLVSKDKKIIQACPEDLILNNKIDEAFDFSDIIFNALLGKFEPKSKPNKWINFHCNNELRYRWMKNALDRKFIGISNENSAVELEFDEQKKNWKINFENQLYNAENVEEVLKHLEKFV